MAPHVEECERAEAVVVSCGGGGVAAVHPAAPAPAQAWVEDEERADSPGENRRLLAPHASPTPTPSASHKPRLQAGLTLGVWSQFKKTSKCSVPQKFENPPAKTKYEKRKEKIIAALKPPYFILSMITIILIIHMWGSEEVRSALEWAPMTWRREPWRLVTYGWVHAGGAHVWLNVLVALAVGWRLEREQGAGRVAVMWAGGVVAGALGAGALQPNVHVVGASAAVYALLTANLPNVCLRFGHIPLWWFRPLSVVVLAASEAAWAWMRAPGAGARAYSHVAWAAHVFGALVGVPLAFLVFTGENAEKRSVVWCRVVSMALLAAGGATAALYYLHCQRVVRM